MDSENHFEIAVIGLGAVGSAALFHLSKSGKKILGLDRFDPPHTMGSSHGETRITRLAVGEGEDYVALAKRSHELWREIELESGQSIMTRTGGILLDSGENPWAKHGSEGFWDRTVRFAKNQEIDHELLDVESFQNRFPFFQTPQSSRIYFEKEAGFLRPEVAIGAQLDLARKNGAQIFTNSPVLQIQKTSIGFEIMTSTGSCIAEKVLISAGGWIKDFLPNQEKESFKICRQVLHWIEVDPEFDWQKLPVWMWGYGSRPEDFIYGFPSLDGRTVKMATESFVEVSHPDFLNRDISEMEQKAFWNEKVQGKINGLKPVFFQSKVCFYTVTEDARFVIQNWEGHPDAILVSACSGHGFKHSTALGEKLAKALLKGLTFGLDGK